jgi:hypothetical protein
VNESSGVRELGYLAERRGYSERPPQKESHGCIDDDESEEMLEVPGPRVISVRIALITHSLPSAA